MENNTQSIQEFEEQEFVAKPGFLVMPITNLGHWLGDIIMAVGGIAITIALAAVVADMGIGLQLFPSDSNALKIMAVIIAVATETQVRSLIRNCRLAIERKAWWIAVLWAAASVPILWVALTNVWAWFLARSEGLTEAQAFAHIGISQEQFTDQRAWIFIFLFVMAVFNFAMKRKAKKISAHDRERQMKEAIHLAPIQVEYERAMGQVDNARIGRGRAAVGKVFTGKSAQPAPEPIFAAASAAPIVYAVPHQSQVQPAAPDYFGSDSYSYEVVPDNDPNPPSNGGGNGGGNGGRRGRGRPANTVAGLVGVADSTNPGGRGMLNLEEAPVSDKLVPVSVELRRQREDTLRGWILAQSIAAKRGERVGSPTIIEAHKYLAEMGIAPKSQSTTEKAMLRVMGEMGQQGVQFDWDKFGSADDADELVAVNG